MAQSQCTTLMITPAGGRSADAQLTEEETLALAQMFKRIGWAELRRLAEDDQEAFEMRSAVTKLWDALGRAGCAPR